MHFKETLQGKLRLYEKPAQERQKETGQMKKKQKGSARMKEMERGNRKEKKQERQAAEQMEIEQKNQKNPEQEQGTGNLAIKQTENGAKEDGCERPDRILLEMDSLSKNEEFARVVVAVFMSRMNPTLEELDDVKTAISEAVTNAVIHGYKNNPGIVYIEALIAGQELTVTIQDKGIGIANLKKAMEPMYTSDQSGERSGMGFSFMEAFMDSLEVESEQGKGTLVRMKKRIGG